MSTFGLHFRRGVANKQDKVGYAVQSEINSFAMGKCSHCNKKIGWDTLLCMDCRNEKYWERMAEERKKHL